MEQGLNNLVNDLRDIEKTMFALGTSPINMDNVSIRLAYDKRWGPTANDAADAIETLERELSLSEIAADDNGRQVEELQAQLPKQGEWELIDGVEPMRWGCSRCKYLSWETSNYCPRCGADMRKMEVQDA